MLQSIVRIPAIARGFVRPVCEQANADIVDEVEISAKQAGTAKPPMSNTKPTSATSRSSGSTGTTSDTGSRVLSAPTGTDGNAARGIGWDNGQRGPVVLGQTQRPQSGVSLAHPRRTSHQ